MRGTEFSRKLAATADRYTKERDYWQRRLAGTWEKTRFPNFGGAAGAGQREETASGYKENRFRLSGELYDRLIRLSGQSAPLLHVLLMAGVVLLLDKYNYRGNGDIIIGAPVLKQNRDAVFVNTILVLRNRLSDNMTVKELLLRLKQTINEAAAHVNYPVETLIRQLNLPDFSGVMGEFPLFDTVVLLENIHAKEDILQTKPNILFSFNRSETMVEGLLEYNPLVYHERTIRQIITHYTHLLGQMLADPDKPIGEIDLLSEEEKQQVLQEFNDTSCPYPREKCIHQLFTEQVERHPGKVAVTYERQSITYGELEKQSNRLAHYLSLEKKTREDDGIGILTDKSIDLAAALLGVLKAGGAYVPIGPDLPAERIKYIINDGAIGVVITREIFIAALERLQWECPSFHTILCLDSRDIYAAEEAEKSALMDKKLWEYVGETAVDEVTGGGWLSSYTGAPIPREEMDEYGDNILTKLKPLLHKNMRLLEIGCASGISMYRLAPLVGCYYGTDFSTSIIRKNRIRCREQGHQNIILSCQAAHEIDQIRADRFDLVIINSVIQCFHGYHYLRKVIGLAIAALGPTGYLFIGDVMDQNLKQDLIRDMHRFKQANKDKGYKTKTDWSVELFIAREFFEDLREEFPVIQAVEFSHKIHTIANELTRYRYDVLVKVEKTRATAGNPTARSKHKYQHDRQILNRYGGEAAPGAGRPGSLAYIMYTSGSRGNPKGVMAMHRNVVRLVKNTGSLEFRPDDKILQTGALAFDASTLEIWGALLNGMTLYLLRKEKILAPGALKWAIRNYGIGIMWMTAPLFNRVLEEDIEVFAGLRNLLVGGEVLSPPHISRLKRRYPRLEVINGYGPTENTTFSTTYSIAREYESPIPIGKPIANSTAYIVGRGFGLQPVGVAGELAVGGDGLARGYLNNPELTAAKFCLRRPGRRFLKKLPPWTPRKNFLLNHTDPVKLLFNYRSPFTTHYPPLYTTGDLARWQPDGNIEFLGRLDTQVKIRGYRVEMGEIENRLKAVDYIQEAVVIDSETTVPGGDGDKYLCAYIVCDPGAKVSMPELKEELSRHLPDYMIPLHIVIQEHIPLTSNGKVDRKALPAPFTPDTGETGTSPRNETQERLQTLWSQVLGLPKETIGIGANFFQLGGHSLRATTLVSLIRKEFNVEFPLSNVFSHPTIRDFDHFIKTSRRGIYEEIQPVEAREYYPQSSAQKRLFFLDWFETAGMAYNMPAAVKITGRPGKARYEKALKASIARHESLRTSFRLVDNQPVQQIHDEADVEPALEYYETNRENALKNFFRPFDLGRAPLFRLGLVLLPGEEYLLVYDLHHIIGDGTSVQVLIKEFLALVEGRELSPLYVQYKDFSCWQNRIWKSGRLKPLETYWLNLYPEAPAIPQLNLPLDNPRPAVFTFKGADHYCTLEGEAALRIKTLGTHRGITLFMKLLAAFNVLLYRYTGQEDIIIGCDIAGRPHDALQGIIGMFVNELPLRSHPTGEKTYLEFLQEVKESSIRAFENQDMQFEDLVDRLNLERDPSRNPLFDVELACQNFERYTRTREFEKSMAGLGTVTPIEEKVIGRAAKFDIALDAYEEEELLSFRFEYCTDLFKKTTIERLAAHFITVLQGLARDPGVSLAAVPLLSEAEQRQVLVEFNRTAREFPREKCYHRLFTEQAGKTPDRIALVGPGGGRNYIAPGTRQHTLHMSYRRLDEGSAQLARYLYEEKGVRPDDRVGILVPRSAEFLMALLGIMKAGGGYVPLDAALPAERLKTMMDDGEIGVVISSAGHGKILDRLQWECPTFHTYLLLDTEHPEAGAGFFSEAGEAGTRELWEYIGQQAGDDISEGGWYSSYTGAPFSKEEMAEYGENALKKLSPLLHREMRVLEIGCASGLTMYRLAPHVGLYYGTDISRVTIQKNRARVQAGGYTNIRLAQIPAHEIHTLGEREFDMIVLNSVVQSFESHGYMRNVLSRAVDLLAEKGYIYVGDVMDLELKEAMTGELKAFKQAHKDKNYTTKIDFSAELFLSRAFFQDISVEIPGIKEVEYSAKIYTIPNELNRYRYDVLLKVDKTGTGAAAAGRRHKYRQGLSSLERYETGAFYGDAVPANLAYMIYTSGTTGRPKGVMIHHLGMVNHLYAKINHLGITAGDIIAQTASASFDISVWQFLAALLTGGRTLVVERETVLEPLELEKVLSQQGVTIFETVPSMLKELIAALKHRRRQRLGEIRLVIPTGEALDPALVRDWYTYYPDLRLVNAYGPTEAADDIAHYYVMEKPAENRVTIPIGKPLQNLRIYILDKYLSLCPVGVRGEICVTGPGVGKGYWRDREKTQKAFVPNPYREKTDTPDYDILYKTGDIGYYREDGNIECLGRLDDQVKIRGHRVQLGEIEGRLVSHPGIKAAVVMDRRDDSGDKYLCAYIVPAGPGGSTEELKEYLSGELPGYMVPSFFITLEGLPLSPSGKVDRRALPAPGQDRPASREFTPPRHEIEKKLAEIWGQVLGIPSPLTAIGMEDDFFAQGGHSLKATAMISAVHRQLKVKIPIAQVFKTPSLRGMSDYIKNAAREVFIGIQPGEKREYYEVSPSQKRMYILNLFMEYNIPLVVETREAPDRQRLEAVFAALVQRHESLRTTFEMREGELVQKVHDRVEFHLDYYSTGETPVRKQQHTKSFPGVQPRGAGSPLEFAAAGNVGDFFRPFDLAAAPLLRVGLVELAGNRHLLLFNIHHIAADGITLGILMQEFARLYRGDRLPGHKIRYRDFARWQNARLHTDDYKKQESYWLERYQGEIPVLEMPTDYPRPAVQRFAGQRIHFRVEGQTLQKTRTLALQEDASLFMVILAVFNVLLGKYTAQEDIVTGTIDSGRELRETEDLVGVFINPLALRNFPAPGKTFTGFLRELKEDTLTAFENRSYPFGDLLDKIVKKKDVSRSPIFDVMLIFQNQGMADWEPVEGMTFLPYEGEAGLAAGGHAQHDMTLWAVEEKAGLDFQLEYCTALFEQTAMARLAGHFLTILDAVVENPGLTLCRIEMTNERERRQLLSDFNDTAAAYPGGQTPRQLFADQVRRSPDRVALTGLELLSRTSRTHPQASYSDISITYGELQQKSVGLALSLREKGVCADSIVGIMTERGIGMSVGVMGIWEAGGAYLPIEPGMPVERISYMLADSGTSWLVTCDGKPGPSGEGNEREEMSIIAVGRGGHVVGLRNNKLTKSFLGVQDPAARGAYRDFSKKSPAVTVAENIKLAYLIYTSGSTGRPKGVLVQQGSFVNAAFAWAKEYRLQEMEVTLLQMAGYSFDVFAGDIARGLLFGGKSVSCPAEVRLEPAALYEAIRTRRITMFESTPALIIPLMDYVYCNAQPLDHLKLLILGSDICAAEEFSRLVSRFGARLRIINSYGVTEATIDTGYYEAPLEKIPRGGNVPIGKPLPNMSFYILDPAGNVQPLGVPGELHIGGKGTARGYLNNPELTAAKFCLRRPGGRFLKKLPPWTPRKNFLLNHTPRRGALDPVRFLFNNLSPFTLHHSPIYKTGDLARWLSDGNVEFLGRIDLQVKIRGNRVELGEIESRLVRCRGVKEAVVSARDSHSLCAYIVFQGPGGKDEPSVTRELRENLARELPGYMVPSYFVFLEKIPLTPGGKVDRKALPAIEAHPLTAVPQPAGDELERRLLAVWAAVLAVPPGTIGSADNFFELGGHSLKAARLAAEIHKELNVKIAIRDVFANPTVKNMANHIRETGEDRYIPIRLAEQKEFYDLTPAQRRFWILSQFAEASLTFNICNVYEVQGEWAKDSFTEAFAALQQRHESLRTVFIVSDGEPKQKILPWNPAGAGLEWIDLRENPDSAAKIEEWVGAESKRLFNLSTGPLVRGKFLRLEEKRCIFLLTMHHIIGDALSLQVFLNELAILYENFKAGQGNRLKALRIQYKDYADWLNKQLGEENLVKLKHYWMNKLSGVLPVLELPLDKERPPVKTYNGAVIRLEFPGELTGKLRATAGQNNATLFMVLVTALEVLLYRYTRQTDIIIGTPIVGRDHSELAAQIGLYLDTLVLRTCFSPADTFLSLLGKVRQVTLEAYEHKRYQFDRLVEDLGMKRDIGRHPVFDVMIDMVNYNAQQDAAPLAALHIEPYRGRQDKIKFDLAFCVYEGKETMEIEIEYNTDLWTETSIRQMGKRYRVLSESIVVEPTAGISELRLEEAIAFAAIKPIKRRPA